MKSGKDLHLFGKQPIKQILKTISGLCKVLISRLKLDKADEGFKFIIEAQKKVCGLDTEDLMVVVKFKLELANMHLMQVDSRNRKIYDPKDRPAQLGS